MKQVTSTEANRDFSKLLQAVAHGEQVQISSRGRPVAVMLPAAHSRGGARAATLELLARLQAQAADGQPRDWSRDDLYR
ncbi:MAG: type II toxin-antitoxin system Phd/YefM family antitoxin [Aquabacterium sp.]|nr:type II toxin-antitoxin system Phd/YefM family antitoxin [Aquabacterium sp.]